MRSILVIRMHVINGSDIMPVGLTLVTIWAPSRVALHVMNLVVVAQNNKHTTQAPRQCMATAGLIAAVTPPSHTADGELHAESHCVRILGPLASKSSTWCHARAKRLMPDPGTNTQPRGAYPTCLLRLCSTIAPSSNRLVLLAGRILPAVQLQAPLLSVR